MAIITTQPSGVHNPTTGGTGTAAWGDAENAALGEVGSYIDQVRMIELFPKNDGYYSADTSDGVEATVAVNYDDEAVFKEIFFTGIGGYDSYRCWSFTLPPDYGTDLTLHAIFKTHLTPATGVLNAKLSAITPNTGVTTHSFDAVNIKTFAAPGTANEYGLVSIALTNDDGAEAGDWCVLHLLRDVDSPNTFDTLYVTNLYLTYTPVTN
jgi:hypothetical protein